MRHGWHESHDMQPFLESDHLARRMPFQKGNEDPFGTIVVAIHSICWMRKGTMNEQVFATTLGFEKGTPWASPGWAKEEEKECMFGTPLFATKQCNIGSPSTGMGFLRHQQRCLLGIEPNLECHWLDMTHFQPRCGVRTCHVSPG